MGYGSRSPTRRSRSILGMCRRYTLSLALCIEYRVRLYGSYSEALRVINNRVVGWNLGKFIRWMMGGG